MDRAEAKFLGTCVTNTIASYSGFYLRLTSYLDANSGCKYTYNITKLEIKSNVSIENAIYLRKTW